MADLLNADGAIAEKNTLHRCLDKLVEHKDAGPDPEVRIRARGASDESGSISASAIRQASALACAASISSNSGWS